MSPTERDGAVAGRRHDSGPDLGHGCARHGQAHLSRDRSTRTIARHGGDAIANGFVYRGKLIPALRDKLVFGDITTGRIWYAESRRGPGGRRRQPDDRRTDSRDRRRPAPAHRRDVPRARREGRRHSRDGRAGWPRPRRPAIRGRQRRRALHPDQERRHDPQGRRREDHDNADARGERARPGCRSERHQPASHQR